MSELSAALDEYLALRRSLGYKLERASRLLADFVAYLDATSGRHITVETALAWAVLAPNPDSVWRAQRLGMVRGFARYLHAIDPGHQIPPTGLVPRGRGRPTPFLFSNDQITAVLAAARKLRSPLRAATVQTVIGLMAVSGLRVREVIHLDNDDVDLAAGLLTVRNSKAGKSRVLPLHPSVVAALGTYAQLRERLCPRPRAASFFISTAGTRLRSGNLGAAFAEVLERAGLPARVARRGPRLGDLRHSFAVQTLLDWYLAGEEVPPRLPALSAYLGHVSPASTYWYLSASPELLAAAAGRLELSLGGRP